jgi:hypothetical protein
VLYIKVSAKLESEVILIPLFLIHETVMGKPKRDRDIENLTNGLKNGKE